MPRKRSVDEVLDKTEVGNVHPETPGERVVRLVLGDIKRVCAFVLILLGVLGSIIIMLCIEKLQVHAFQLFSALVTDNAT